MLDTKIANRFHRFYHKRHDRSVGWLVTIFLYTNPFDANCKICRFDVRCISFVSFVQFKVFVATPKGLTTFLRFYESCATIVFVSAFIDMPEIVGYMQQNYEKWKEYNVKISNF